MKCFKKGPQKHDFYLITIFEFCQIFSKISIFKIVNKALLEIKIAFQEVFLREKLMFNKKQVLEVKIYFQINDFKNKKFKIPLTNLF